MADFDLREIEALFQIYLDKESAKINKYIQKQVSEYVAMLYLEIMRGWDSWYSFYKPRVYKRTGRTERGIDMVRVRKQGNKYVASVEFQDSMMYNPRRYFYGSKKTQGHSYAMIDLGWQDSSLKSKYLYSEFDGWGITEGAIARVNAKKPDWLEIEIVASDNLNSSNRNRASQYRAMNRRARR